MPVFLLFTNLPARAIPKGFLLETSTVIAKAIREPESLWCTLGDSWTPQTFIYCERGPVAIKIIHMKFKTVRIHPDQMMSHGGTTDLCANSELMSIRHIGNEENIQMSKEISEFLQQKLGIDPKRNCIKFTNLKPLDVGYEGTTFEVLWK